MSLIRKDWNVVARLTNKCFELAKWHLQELGIAGETDRPDILVAKVADPQQFAESLADKWQAGSSMFEYFEYIRPVHQKFRYSSESELLDHITRVVEDVAPEMADTCFDINAEARGLIGENGSAVITEVLEEVLLDRIDDEGGHATIDAKDCDILLDVEMIDGTVGVAMWNRKQLNRYPFLQLGPVRTIQRRPRLRHR